MVLQGLLFIFVLQIKYMKKILLGALLLLSTSLFSQTNLPDTLIVNPPIGLKFSMSVIEVKNYMLSKKIEIDLKYSNSNRVIYNHVKIGNITYDFIKLSFDDNGKLFGVRCSFVPTNNATLQNYYDDVRNMIIDKYYIGESYRNFESPYHDGDGYEMQAISLEKGSISTYWTFKNSMISLYIDKTMSIELSYQDIKLAEIYFEKQKVKQLNDF